MRSTHALEALRASKYRLRYLVIGGRWEDSTIDRRGGDAADGGPTLPGVRDKCYRGDRCSSMSLACGHAHLNSGITTARSVRSADAKCTPGEPGLPSSRVYE
jgi:hypothetical protein